MGAQLDPRFEHRHDVAAVGARLAGLAERPARLLLHGQPPPSAVGTVLEWMVVWWLHRHPAAHVAVVTYAHRACGRVGQRLARLIEEHERELGLKVVRTKWDSSSSWELRTGGSVSVWVPGARPPGRADLLIVDDPHCVLPEAHDPERRAGVVDGVLSIAERHAADAPAVAALRSHHPDDLGRVLPSRGWELIER